MGRVRVFIASSLDGFIAGEDDDLDWLPAHDEGIEDTFTPFMAQVGALLMGRRTYDVALGFGSWAYGDTPVLVATHRPLASSHPTVRAACGDILDLVARAKEAAGAKDVYVDGGTVVRSALDAGLVDELVVTIVPVILGSGVPLFAGTARRHRLELVRHREIGAGLLQLRYLARPS